MDSSSKNTVPVARGIITRGIGGLYTVRTPSDGFPGDELFCRARGIFRKNGLTPTVGDLVVISERAGSDTGAEDRKLIRSASRAGIDVDWVIDDIEDRDNIFIRPPVANLDYMFAVVPCASPEPDLLTLDKLTVIAENYGLETVVIVTKTDLDPETAEKIASVYTLAGYRVFKVSCVTGDGMEKLRNFTESLPLTKDPKKGYVSGAFAGVSGAGKSTVMTNLFPDLGLETGEVSRKTERGRHTTRKVELFPVRTGKGLFWLADTPGFSLLDFARFEFFPLDELPGSFREFGDFLGRCRYRKCTHLREEGCAVLEAVAEGRIASVRHADYITIYEEQKELQKWKRKQGAKDTL